MTSVQRQTRWSSICLLKGSESNCRARSGLKIIPGPAGSYFCAVQGERSAIDRVSMSDEQRENAQNGAGPARWVLKPVTARRRAQGLVVLFPSAATPLALISGPNATTDNFETASSVVPRNDDWVYRTEPSFRRMPESTLIRIAALVSACCRNRSPAAHAQPTTAKSFSLTSHRDQSVGA